MLNEALSGRLNIPKFLAFLESRPEGERWDLIEGVAVLMQPPTFAHRRIGANFMMLLNPLFSAGTVDAYAYQEVAICVPGVDDFLPRPDVVVGPGLAGYELYSDYFLLAAEILSPTNSWLEIGTKLTRYIAAPHCLYAMVVDPMKVHIEIFARASAWQSLKLMAIDSDIELPEFGFHCTAGDLYRGTPLNSSRPGESQ